MGHLSATGFYMIQNRPTSKLVKYGLLYNNHALIDVRGICPSGWHVPTSAEIQTLINKLGGYNTDTAKALRDDNGDYWSLLNDANNISGISIRGTGYRVGSTGAFSSLLSFGYFTSITAGVPNTTLAHSVSSGNEISKGNLPVKNGRPLRLLKDDSSDPGSMRGNDRQEYPTVKIENQVWLACDYAETKYRNGDSIPEVTDNAAWAALTTGALCAYNNDWDNVFI